MRRKLVFCVVTALTVRTQVSDDHGFSPLTLLALDHEFDVPQ